MLTYLLTDTGYQILRNGVLWIDQPFQPGVEGFVPFATREDAEAAALELIAREQAQQ
jgi:hypothetical protein